MLTSSPRTFLCAKVATSSSKVATCLVGLQSWAISEVPLRFRVSRFSPHEPLRASMGWRQQGKWFPIYFQLEIGFAYSGAGGERQLIGRSQGTVGGM